MKNFGFADYDKVIYIGTNGKMNEVSAAMGLSSLDSLDEFVQANRRNYNKYREALTAVPGVRRAAVQTGGTHQSSGGSGSGSGAARAGARRGEGHPRPILPGLP